MRLAAPGFPVRFVTSTDFHAAFLNESRTRGHFQCNLREIRARSPSNRRMRGIVGLIQPIAQGCAEPPLRPIKPVEGLRTLDSQLLHYDRCAHRTRLI
jgi:hypothetical protein